jgi:hypothetical protein
LFIGQGVVEGLDGGFGGTALARRGDGPRRGEQGQPNGRDSGGYAHRAQKIATIDTPIRRFTVRTDLLLLHDVLPSDGIETLALVQGVRRLALNP